VTQLWTTLGLGSALFVATNIDDIFILLALFADPRLRARQIVAGQLLGMSALIVVTAGASAVAVALASKYVGLLGLAPLGIGVARLLWRADEDAEEPPSVRSAGKIVAVTIITLANGGDNLAIYVPVFARQTRLGQLVLSATFMILTAAWCWLGYTLVHHPKLGAPIRRYAAPATPYVLIALGVYILSDLAR
jgi:cadmium resistance protein CadD (predicted permease)